MVATVTLDTRIYSADNFMEAFSEKSPDIAYLFIGRSAEWPVAFQPPSPAMSPSSKRTVFDEMLAMKKVSTSNMIAVARRFDWVSGTVYVPYDDEITNPLDLSQVGTSQWVLSSEAHVYKCIDTGKDSTGAAVPSTVEPTGQPLTGTIQTADGYIWKYMYSLTLSGITKYLSSTFMPVTGINSGDVRDGAIDGAIHRIKVTNGGSGYVSAPTVTITGNGSNCTATAVVNGGVVTEIVVNSVGSGYRNATVSITPPPAGTTATARAIISPIGGHGFDARKELHSVFVMVRGEFVNDESGKIPTNISYRTVGMIVNPRLTATTAKTLKLTNYAYDFVNNDVVRSEGSGSVTTGYGRVVKWDYRTGELTVIPVVGQPEFSFSSGNSLYVVGGSPSSVAAISSVQNLVNVPATGNVYSSSEVLKDAGEIVYIENRQAVQRNAGQTEIVKLVIEF